MKQRSMTSMGIPKRDDIVVIRLLAGPFRIFASLVRGYQEHTKQGAVEKLLVCVTAAGNLDL